MDRDRLWTWLIVRFRQGVYTLLVLYQRKIFAEAKAMRDPSLTPIAWGVNWVRNGHLWKLQLVIGDDYVF